MDKKTLLAEATRKLERQQAPAGPSADPGDAEHGVRPDASTSGRHSRAMKKSEQKVQPVISKGITLRPSNVEKLDRLELSLRKQGIKAGHSGLIQIAIDLLEDNDQLAVSYRELLKLDLRLR